VEVVTFGSHYSQYVTIANFSYHQLIELNLLWYFDDDDDDCEDDNDCGSIVS